jgi:hypothetical protein
MAKNISEYPTTETPPGGHYPDDTPNVAFSYEDDSDTFDDVTFTPPPAPDTRLGDLPAPADAGYPLAAQSNTGEDTRTTGETTSRGNLFDWAHAQLQPASSDVAGQIPPQLDALQTKMQSAKSNFLDSVNALDNGPSPWQGATHDAAWAAITDSFKILDTLAIAVGNLSILSDGFSRIMFATKTAFGDQNYSQYKTALTAFPESHNAIVQEFDTFARNFIQGTYNTNIKTIASNVPNFNIAAIAQIAGANTTPGGANNGPGTGPGGGPGGGGGGGGGVSKLAGSGGGVPNLAGSGGGVPNIPMPNVPTDPNLATLASAPTTSTQTPTTSTTSPDTSAATTSPATDTSALQGLGQAAMPLGEAAQSLASPLQSAMSAAQQAGNRGGVPTSPNGLGKLPLQEGALAKGLNKGGAAGVGAGTGASGTAISNKPAAGAPSTAADTAGRTVAAASRAGLSSAASGAAGAPGAGTPGSGQHGAAAQGTQHQASKALRHKKNGEELIGDTEAVVPVLGEPEHSEAGKPGEPTGTDSDTIQRHQDRPPRKSPVPVPGFPQPGR